MNSGGDYTFLHKFKEKVESYCLEINNKYSSIQQSIKEREDALKQSKDSLKTLKR
jgi:hypothetical protein